MFVILLLVISMVILVFYALYVCLTAPSKPDHNFIKTDSKNQRVSLASLASIWINKEAADDPPQENIQDPPAEGHVFQNHDLEEFYKEHVAGNASFPLQAITVIREILEILDEEGSCPSVVNVQGEAESLLEGNAYNVLAAVHLRRHTLNTVREMLRLIEPGPMTPVAMVAALGHDLGKIPGFRKKLYSLGDHPVISVTVLQKISGFSQISNKDDIIKAIRDHHRRPIDFLSVKLKEADQEARRKELAEGISLGPAENSAAPAEHTHENEKPPLNENNQSHDHDVRDDNSKKTRPREVELPWFDGQAILGEIEPRINAVDEGRWDAFSMSNGYVYVQVAFFWSVLKKVSRQNGDSSVFMGDADTDLRRNILYSVVERLKSEQNAVARGIIRDGYFCAPFVLTMRDGTVYPKAWYVPFNLEAFGRLASDMESQKYGKVKEIVEVAPRWEKT